MGGNQTKMWSPSLMAGKSILKTMGQPSSRKSVTFLDQVMQKAEQKAKQEAIAAAKRVKAMRSKLRNEIKSAIGGLAKHDFLMRKDNFKRWRKFKKGKELESDFHQELR